MANEFLITDVVSSKAIQDLNKLLDKFKEVKEDYSALAQELAKGIKVPVHNYDELTKKAKSFEEIQKKLSATEKELIQVQQEYKTLLKNVAEEVRKNTKEALEYAKANDLNAQAELKAAKTETERLKQQKLLNQEKKKLKITTEEAISLTTKEVHSINEAKEQNKLLRLAVSQVTDAEDKDNKIRQQLNNQISKNTEYIRRNSDAYTKQKMAIGSYKNEIKAALVELQNGNNSFKNLGVVAKGFGGILKSSIASGLYEVSLGVSNMIKGFVGAQAVIGVFQRLIGLFKSGIRSVIDFEAENSKLAAILGTTSRNIKDLTTDAQRLGAATKYTAAQATSLQIELAKLGFSRNEILQATEYVLKFAQATGAELPEAAALAGAALRMFNADTSETERYVSAMAVATTKSALSFSYLQTAMPIVGPVAKAFNFQIEDTLALLGKLADAGFDASMSATATRNILLNLADGSGKLAQALGKPVKTLPELVDGLKKLKEQGIDLNSTLELTDKRSVAAFNAFLTAADKIVPLREQITGVDKELGDMADTMGDNVQGAIYGLSSAWEAFVLSIIKSQGTIKKVIDSISEWLRNLAFEGMSGEEDVLGMETKLQKDAQALSKGDVEKAREEFNNRMAVLMKDGLNEEEAYNKAVEELSNKRIDISVKEEKKIEWLREKAVINTQNWKDDMNEGWGYINNKFANFFRYTTSTAQKADEALTDYAKGYTEYMKSIAFNAGIDKIISEAKPVVETSNKKLPKTEKELEKERQALEKAAKERLRIREALQQSELDLMDEGLEKELAKISLNYNKRIAAIKGNSEDEQNTRKNLAEAMQRDLEEKQISYGLDKEKSQIQTKLDLVKKGSEEEYNLRLQLLDNEREQAINEAVRKGEEVFLIDEKYKKKQLDLEEKHASDINKKIQESYASQSVIMNVAMSDELDDLTEQYAKGLIKKEDYEKRKIEITEKYAIKQAELAIELAKEQLNTSGLSPEDSLKLEQQIAEAEIELAEKVRDAEIKAIDDASKATEEKMEKTAKAIQAISDLLGGFADLGNAIFENKISQIEEEQDANDEAYEREIERIEALQERGAISTEEAEARKRAAEDKTRLKEEELAKKKAALQEKQAKWDKANNIVQTIMATSLGIMKASPNLVMMALIGAMGAIQLATIVAQQIPKYAKGTKDHPGGLAIVGDGGKKEGVITEKGLFVTPDKPTLVDLPKHSQVMPDLSFIYDKKGLGSDFLLLEQQKKNMADQGIVVNIDNDYSRLEKRMEGNTKQLQSINKLMKKANRNAEFNWISKRV